MFYKSSNNSTFFKTNPSQKSYIEVSDNPKQTRLMIINDENLYDKIMQFVTKNQLIECTEDEFNQKFIEVKSLFS